jgi:alpha-tubulin suppressor-like RCC1 family protein
MFDTWTPDGLGHFYVADRKFKGIAAGNFHALAINVDKTVEAWGSNATGQLNVPEGVRFKDVAGGFGYSLGLDVSGRLIAWGDNSMGQLNVPYGKFDAISAVAFHVEAIAH